MVQRGGYSVEPAPVLLGAKLPMANDLKSTLCEQEDHKHQSSGRERPLRALVQRSSSLNEAAVLKRESAIQHMEAGNFTQAWELYNDIGDRVAAQDALEKAYRSSKRERASKLSIQTCDTDWRMEDACLQDLRSASGSPEASWLRPCMEDARMQDLRTPPRSASGSPEAIYGDGLRPRPALSAMSTRDSLSTPDSLKMSETRRPLSGGSLPSSVKSSDAVLAKMLRRSLGVNARKADKVKELFHKWNCDGSDAMSRQEFAEGVKSVLPFTADTDLDAAFSVADADGEGFIIEQQFVKWLLQA